MLGWFWWFNVSTEEVLCNGLGRFCDLMLRAHMMVGRTGCGFCCGWGGEDVGVVGVLGGGWSPLTIVRAVIRFSMWCWSGKDKIKRNVLTK